MLFAAVPFSFSVITMGGKYTVFEEKYSFRNVHSCHRRLSLDRQGGDMVGVKPHEVTIHHLSQGVWLVALQPSLD